MGTKYMSGGTKAGFSSPENHVGIWGRTKNELTYPASMQMASDTPNFTAAFRLMVPV
jgi:hypothetical protein